MKVAIIGAGLAGMACAHELKRHDISPTIFESKDYIGETLHFPVVLLNVFNSPIYNPLNVLDKKYNLKLIPHYNIREINMFGPNRICNLKGDLGYIFRRGRGPNTITQQMLDIVEMPVNMNTNIKLDEVRYTHDYVVVATGNEIISKEMNNATTQFDAYVRIATTYGKMKTDLVNMWLNTEYANHGFGYMVAQNENEGRLILIVDSVDYEDFEGYWSRFTAGVVKDFEITGMIDLRHTIGLAKHVKVDNIYFTGNAAGLIDSFLGFGSIKAILSGVSAGRCIVEGIDYEQYMKKTIKDVKAKYEFRKAMNTFNNDDIDRVLAIINTPGLKQFLYCNPMMKAVYGVPLVKIYNKFK